jgi:hypothetical protein
MMELWVFNNTTLREVQEKFSHYFPFLKLDFFIYHHHTEDSPFKKEVFKGIYLEETSDFFKEGTIYFSPATTIAELEQEFQIELGLAARVYRRSIDAWVDTSQTAHLSLAKQNNMGAAVVRPRFNIHTLFL